MDFRGGPIDGNLDVAWIHGAPPGDPRRDPPLQVHRFDAHTVILRQSKQETREAPFLYLLFGDERAFLLDTGDVSDPEKMPLRATVDRLVDEWLSENPRDNYSLVVAHSHGHGDHIRGDAQLGDRPSTVMVSPELPTMRKFFGFDEWPGHTVQFDLGGRVLELTGTPGHHQAALTVFDPWSGFLLTGDTVYPGRLYVDDAPAFRATLSTLIQIVETRPVRAIMGCHIEMTKTPRRDYPIGTKYQPEEAELPMTTAQLREVRDAAYSVGDVAGAHIFDDFAIYNGRCVLPVVRQLLRRTLESGRLQAARALNSTRSR